MEEKSKIDNVGEDCQSCLHRIIKTESDGEVNSQKIKKTMGEIKSFSCISESDDSKRSEEITKTVTFSEDIEIVNPIIKTAMAIKISIDLPVNLTGQQSLDHFKQDEHNQHDDMDMLSIQDIESMQSIDLESTDILVSLVGEEHILEHEVEFDTKTSAASRKSLHNISKKSTNIEHAETSLTEKDFSSDVQPKIIQLNDGHKEFKVQNVDESSITLGHENVNAKRATEDIPFDDACLEFQRAPSTLSDGVLPSTDVNYQDTIGPLDNPAFLKKLQYSVSRHQTVIQDELCGLKSNVDTGDISILQDPPDLDKGWAWVVLAAGFTANALLGATIYASGVLMLAILTEINPDITKAAWVGSLFVCAMCLSGPFVEAAITNFSTKTTVFCASILLSAGFVGASFATNISQLILTHGLIAGIGAGFIVNPMSVAVGQYFMRYRGLACGLMATGAGAGMLTGGTIISVLLNQYGLGGTYLIWAGVLLHTAILGLLLRPSPEERLRTLERDIAAKEINQHFSNQPDVLTGPSSLCESVNQSMLSGINKIGLGKKTGVPKNFSHINSRELETPLLKVVLCQELPSNTHKSATNKTLPCSNVTSQHHKFHQSFVSEDLQLVSLSKSPTDTPKANSNYPVPLYNHHTLSNNVSKSLCYENSDIIKTSNLIPITYDVLSSTLQNTCDLNKINYGEGSLGHNTFSKIISGDQDISLVEPVLQLELPDSVAKNRAYVISRVSSPILRNKFSQSVAIGDRQYKSLHASPSGTSKSNSPPTISSYSRQTLTSNVHTSSSQDSIHIEEAPDLTHLSFTPNSPAHSPASIRGAQMHNKIQLRHMSHSSLSQYTSLSHSSLRLSLRGSLHPSHAGEIDSESITSTLVSQYRPRDGLTHRFPKRSKSISTLMGSVSSIPVALAIAKDDASRYEVLSSVSVGVHERGLKGLGIKMLDSMRLLTRKPFVVFLSVCFLWSFGESPVMIYLPSFAISQGTSSMLASILYTAMGAGSIIGRFLSGLTATDRKIGAITLYTGCIGVAGLLIALSPLFTATFLGQIIFSSLVGIYTGSLVPLSSLIVIEMLDIKELGMGFGFISMVQGIGYLIGPPLAGIVVTSIGYRKSFVFSGCVLIFGSLVAMCISVFKIETENEQESNDQLYKSDLEKITENCQEDE